MLLVVGDEVLDARRHAAALQPVDVGHRQVGGEHRVLREALEVAAAQRRALEVDGGAEQHLGALGARLLGQRGADALDQVDVPRGARARRRTGTTPTAGRRRSAGRARRWARR